MRRLRKIVGGVGVALVLALWLGIAREEYVRLVQQGSTPGADTVVGALLLSTGALLLMLVFLGLCVAVLPIALPGAAIGAVVWIATTFEGAGYPYIGIALAIPIALVGLILAIAVFGAITSGGGAHISGWFKSD